MDKIRTDFPAFGVSRSGPRLPFGLGGTAPAPQYRAVETVQRHWNSLRAERLAPARDDIDPRQLAECLDVMFIAELVAPRVARLRLCGQGLYDLLGLEPRGMPLAVFFEAPARETLADALAQVAQGARVLLPMRSARALGRPAIDGMLLLLPLTDHSGKITRIMGVLETHGPVGRAPCKFGLTAGQITGQITHCDTGPAPAGHELSGISNAPIPVRDIPPQPQSARERRAAFRVIPGGRTS